MNEKLQYATMLEIPVNTCSITEMPKNKKKTKRKKSVNPEAVKQQLISKVNEAEIAESQESVPAIEERNVCAREEYALALADGTAVEDNSAVDYVQNAEQSSIEAESVEETESSASVYSKKIKKKTNKKPFKFSIIGIQLAVIAVLVATIFLTNALYEDSGINVFFRNVFGGGEVVATDARTFEEFTPVIAMGDNGGVVLSEGVISFDGEGSVYAPCDGTVTAITQGVDGKYSVEITHSDNFKTLLSGVDYAYAGLNDKVYRNIPVGYLEADGATMCFMLGDGTVISDYQIIDDTVVWAV